MFRNLKFATKIGLLSALAAASFMLILAILLVTGHHGANLLVDIERGYYASLELNRQLYEDIAKIQGSFQDAASMADPEFIVDADESKALFIKALEHGLKNEVVDTVPLKELQTEFLAYYDLASTTTGSLLDGSGDMELYSNLQTMSDMYNGIVRKIELLMSRDKQAVTNSIATAQQTQRYATLFLALVAVVSLMILVLASVFIIRSASGSVQTTVEGMNALAAGDLSREFRARSGDEMGHMVDRVQHVTTTINLLTNEIEGLVQAVRAGELDARGDSDRFQGAYARLVDNINDLIEAFAAPIEVTASYVERISHGDMPPPIRDEYHGDFNKIKENLNVLRDTMNELINQVATMTSAGKAGNLNQRGDAEEFSGVWRELVNGINDTLDAVTGPMQEFSGVMSALAHGDLSFRSQQSYEGEFAEFQDDMNATVAKLTDVISNIKGSGDYAASVANEISEGNRSLRRRTDEQARKLRETSGTMAEMTETVQQNAANAQRAKHKVSEASERAKKGGAVVQKAVAAMDAINASSTRISDIINVIDEIAFQTNLLALNAAVEAARAGEEGKGFAVVASEVRNLAGRSATAAKEINDLIQDSVNKVDEGSRLVHESGQTLEEIVSAVIDVDNIVGEISESSQLQAASIAEVGESVSAMESMTKKNAELADAAVQASIVMGEEADRLNRMTAFFRMQEEARRSEVDAASVAANDEVDGAMHHPESNADTNQDVAERA